MRIDQVMIKSMLDAKAVGIYAVAVNLTEIWYFIPTMIIGSLFPAIINARKNDYKLYLNGLQRLHDIFFLIAFVIGITVSLCSSKIIGMLFGESFMEARTSLVIYIWSVVFVFQGGIRGHFLIVENEQKMGLYFKIIALLVNIGLNLIMVPLYGIEGAAITTLISYSLPVYVFSFFHPVLRLNLLMCLRSYISPFRLIYYGRGIFK
jgi:O-antigen/teichoic acid export membrane protein